MNSFTTNYNLDLYDVDDKPNLNDQYNDAMGKIDNAMHDMAGDIVTAETAVQNLTVKVDGYDGRITQNAADITTLQTDVQTAQTTAENAVSAANDANDLAVQASSAAQTAQTTADNINTRLTQEITNRTNADTNLQNQINNIDVSGGNPTETLRKSTFVFVGDSYAQAESSANTWTGQLMNIIGNKATYYNASVSGSGFTTDTRFAQQILNQANKMTDTQRNAVDYVIVAGGRNDIGSQSFNTLTAAAQQCVSNTVAQFPNATLVMVPMLWSNGAMQSSYDYNKAFAYLNGATSNSGNLSIIPVNYAWTWLRGIGGVVQSDGIHPNSTGAKIMAHYIISAISGSYSGRTGYYLYGDNNINLELIASGGTVDCFVWAGNSPAFPSGGIENVIPAGYCPVRDVSAFGYTNSGTAYGIGQFTRSGTFNIYQKSGALGGVQFKCSWAW